MNFVFCVGFFLYRTDSDFILFLFVYLQHWYSSELSGQSFRKSQNLLRSIHVPSKHWYCTLLHWAAKGNPQFTVVNTCPIETLVHVLYIAALCCKRQSRNNEVTEFTAVNTCPIETLVLYIAALGCKRKSQNLLRSIHVPSKHCYRTLLH